MNDLFQAALKLNMIWYFTLPLQTINNKTGHAVLFMPG